MNITFAHGINETGPDVKLSEIHTGATVILSEFGNTAVHVQLLAMGVGPGALVKLIRRMPLQGNLYLEVGTRRFALRYSEAQQLEIHQAV